MQTVVLASGNAGKLREFNALLQKVGFQVEPQSNYGVSNADETGLSFVENAIIKARHACTCTDLPSIADDSGIEVDALQGAPGIYSARYSGDNSRTGANDNKNNLKLLDALKNIPESQRSARYQCVLVFMQHANDPTPIIAQGSWEGRILEQPTGDGGFGYDPIFWVPTHNCSGAQMSKEEKNSISHRAIAMQNLIEKINNATNLSS